jgi:hypothetical protein
VSQESRTSTIRRYVIITLCTCLVVFAIIYRKEIKTLLPDEISDNVSTIIDMRDNGR